MAAELCRQGLLATTFTGNVPHFDILAADQEMRPLPIQVKTIRGGDWQFNAKDFLDITFVGPEGDERQVVRGKVKQQHPDLIHVFVRLSGKAKERDRFFVLRRVDLQGIVATDYCEYLKRVGGKRPKNRLSTHTRVTQKMLEEYEDNWKLIQEHLPLAGGRLEDRSSS